MLITLPNANFAATGLGQVTRLINGMPQADLIGLWLFDEGNDGDPVNSVADRSGFGNHATLRDDWSAGVRRSYGMEVTTNEGTVLQTAIPINPSGQKLTVFVAGANTLPGSEAQTYNTWVGASANPGMALPTDSHTNAPSLALNYTGNDASPAWQILDISADMIGQTVLNQGSNQPDYGDPGIAAIETDGLNNTAKLHALGAASLSVSNAAVGTFYDGVTNRGNLEFGVWPHTTVRSAASTIAHVYAVAAYARTFTETEAQAHMAYMQTIAEAKGVTF